MTKMILSTHIDCIIPEWNNLEVLYNIPVCANLNATTYDDINHEIGQINKKFVWSEQTRFVIVPQNITFYQVLNR